MKSTRSSGPPRRKRVGLLVDAFDDEFQSRLLRAAMREAHDNGLDLLAVGGGVLGLEQSNPRTFIYDLISPASVDALLVATHVIGHHSTLTEVSRFVARYAPLPCVSLGVELERREARHDPGRVDEEIEAAEGAHQLLEQRRHLGGGVHVVDAHEHALRPVRRLQPLEAGTYYHHQLIGCAVDTVAGEHVGRVVSVEGGAAGSVLEVEGSRGQVLIPLAVAICVEIDVEAKRIRIDPPEGLLDVNR